MSGDADMENVSIGPTSCKVHQSANGGEKTGDKAVDMSRGGRNTKIHTLVDGLGPGNEHDSKHAVPLLKKTGIKGRGILSDKACGAQTIRDYISSQEARCTISPQSSCNEPRPVGCHIYRERHFVERFFQQFKWFRRIFTRYDKLDASFLAFVYIAAVMVLLKEYKCQLFFKQAIVSAPAGRRSRHSSLYLALRPRAFSTG